MPAWDHELFVSYAHVDDRYFLDVHLGWVSQLVEVLRRELEVEAGRPEEVRIWRDSEALRGNHAVSPEISRRVRSSALLLVVLSPGYIKSRWCQQELELFVESRGTEGDWIFVVEKIPVERDRWPAVLRNRKTYSFWYADDQ